MSDTRSPNTPSRTRIKICGITTPADARAAAEAGADAIGLVFAEGSPRQVDLEQAKEIVGFLPALVEPVALFTEHSPEAMRQTALACGIRTLQLHGEPLWHSAATELDDFRLIAVYEGDAQWHTRYSEGPAPADMVLLDTPRDADGRFGGTGHTADWKTLAEKHAESRPSFLLAGGLTPDNVGEAIRTVRPWGVDVSSGVESSRGVKDHGLIRAFCEAVREADASLAMD